MQFTSFKSKVEANVIPGFLHVNHNCSNAKSKDVWLAEVIFVGKSHSVQGFVFKKEIEADEGYNRQVEFRLKPNKIYLLSYEKTTSRDFSGRIYLKTDENCVVSEYVK